jgi:hypothetical protein
MTLLNGPIVATQYNDAVSLGVFRSAMQRAALLAEIFVTLNTKTRCTDP